MKKRAVLSQPFIFIFAIIVAALVLIFGFRAILNLLETSKFVEVSNFVINLGKDVDTYYFLDPGSTKEIKINLPREVKNICFKNANQMNIRDSEIDTQSRELMRLTNNNLFILPLDSFPNTQFKINNLGQTTFANSFQCFKNGNSFKIVSQGRFVIVEA